ncbi:MAG: 2-C-methyl-D-erythritol 2,4-cyclodiphosphate synthase [Verrucomicrobia bacterium]|nr:2-C-methyl-D-erythritol 2,4-cyclodiphosphate synthase [Verrucomicrobiota bacterium]
MIIVNPLVKPPKEPAADPKSSSPIEPSGVEIPHPLGLHPNRIGIKATTNESMGFLGRSEGMAALATACMDRPEK